MLSLDRREFIAALGGTAAVGLMSHEARADALEHAMMGLNPAGTAMLGGAAATAAASGTEKFPTVAELEASVSDASARRGTGGLFINGDKGAKVPLLPKMPAKPTLMDFYELRFTRTRNHCYQSAALALKNGVDEEIVLACLLHDTVIEMMRPDHGWWGSQMYAPYVSERVTFAIRYHQALRFFPDEKAGYAYPDLYKRMFGVDYTPPPHIQAAYAYARKHKWYDVSRAVTVNDLYAFDPTAKVSLEPFVDIIGRHFKQPKEGLGNDNSATAHMFRTLINPDSPL